MPTLAKDVPFSAVADILHAAMVLGRTGAGRSEPAEANVQPELLRDIDELFQGLDERRISYVLVGDIALLTYMMAATRRMSI